MATLTAIAPAKLNLALHITGKRLDGYHLLESLVAFTDMGDALSVTSADSLSLEVTGPFTASCGAVEQNLVMQAARLLQEKLGVREGASITLDKQIPVGAGLGGGSSDAATVCRLLCRLWGHIVPDPGLAQWLLALGADMPMCVAAKPLIARGIGEDITLLPHLPGLHAVLCWPGIVLDTKRVYEAYRQETAKAVLTFDTEDAERLLTSLAPTRNMLQRAAVSVAPEVAEALLTLETLPQRPFVRMSGSGACCVAYFVEAQAASAVAEHVASRYPGWWVRQAAVLGV